MDASLVTLDPNQRPTNDTRFTGITLIPKAESARFAAKVESDRLREAKLRDDAATGYDHMKHEAEIAARRST